MNQASWNCLIKVKQMYLQALKQVKVLIWERSMHYSRNRTHWKRVWYLKMVVSILLRILTAVVLF